MELQNKVALVTGAGRGIGKAIALGLARHGATVIGADINQEMVNNINNYLNVGGNLGKGIMMDVTNRGSINAAIEQIKSEFTAPQILVNNAGITRDNLMLRMKDNEWNEVINTNLNSIFNVTQACLRDMVKARWGRIIGITSVVGITGNAGQANYSAAKAGMIAFTKSLAQEVASRGITANTIAPGFIDTEMTRKLTDEQRQMILDRVPMHKIGSPDDVANSVVFLASDKAEYITGVTIHVNGGMFMS